MVDQNDKRNLQTTPEIKDSENVIASIIIKMVITVIIGIAIWYLIQHMI